MLDNAFEALKTFDWGTDLAVVAPIEEAVAAAHGKTDLTADLENRLLAALTSDLARDARDYLCRKLAIIGTAAAVPTLAGLLLSETNSHMARFALERIPAPEAAQALREALGRVNGNLKIGVISSLGGRRDVAAVGALAGLLRENDAAIARAAALALGAIGSVESAAALTAFLATPGGDKRSAVDALLACGEALLAANRKSDALSIYKSLAGEKQARIVRLAATRGILSCSGRQV
jgi:HEAT repeat protein